MKIKILSFVVGALFLLSISPIIQASGNLENDQSIKTQQINGYILLGFMQREDPNVYNGEFEVLRFAILRGQGETVRLDQGDMIEIKGSIFCIIFNDFIFGYVGNYELIH